MQPRTKRRAFSLVEAMIALTILAVAGAALLLGVDSSVQQARDSVERTIAFGMARQLMDEVAGMCYMDPSTSTPYQTTLCPSSGELAVGNRNAFDDIDDFVNYTRQPPVDPWNVALGTDNGGGGQRDPYFYTPTGFFTYWKQYVDVYYVDPSDLSQRLASGQTSDYRAVEVRIYRADPQGRERELARLRRVFAYVPSTP
ncbi:MAG: prepilin-type N-terminal cleavage/methylation domain-containing protein [Pirellulales bacterium]|nr:prepilin-type N-terminal cleavage/methylation domain-containing protein [Pirellulales bacterium]